VVDLGVLTITNIVPDRDAAQKQLLFLPGLLTDGIELSDDPIAATRDAAYPTSFPQRNQ
jgi:catalase